MIIVLSIMEVKYMAITEAAKWMCQFLECDEHRSATILKSDNQEMITLTKNPINHSRIKHIDLHHYFIRDTIENEII